MKLLTQLLDQDHDLQLKQGDESLSVTIDDRSYELEVQELDDSQYLLRDGNETYNCLVGGSTDHPRQFNVQLRGNSYEITVTDPKRLRSGQTSGGEKHGSARILASMPGKVVRVLVEVGAEVEAGAGIVVVEAMKMQNEMKAPRAGRVASISAIPGSTVNAGDVLAVIE